jgi:hypothetical protein
MPASVCLQNATKHCRVIVTDDNVVNYHKDQSGKAVWCIGKGIPAGVKVIVDLINNFGEIKTAAVLKGFPVLTSSTTGDIRFLLPPLPSSQNAAGVGAQFMIQLSWENEEPVVSVPFFSFSRSFAGLDSVETITSHTTRHDAVYNKTFRLAVTNKNGLQLHCLTQYLLDELSTATSEKKHHHIVSFVRPHLLDVVDPLKDLPISSYYSATNRTIGQKKDVNIAMEDFKDAWLEQLNRAPDENHALPPPGPPPPQPVSVPVVLDPQLKAILNEYVRSLSRNISHDMVNRLGLQTVQGPAW